MLNGKKIIEIRKTGFVNKGAELMLFAVLEKMQQSYSDAKFAMVPSSSISHAPYTRRAKLGLYQKPHLLRREGKFDWIWYLLPKNVRDMYGVVLNREVDVVMDAAGFAYSDQWGTVSCLELAVSCKQWRKNGTKVVLLPQAFGPFKNWLNRKAIKIAFDHADLVFARDKISYDYLVEVVGERPNLKLAPDFTNLIDGVVPDSFDKSSNRFCIVPNYRMVDKTSKVASEAYLPFMIEVTRYAYEKGQKPFILVHEGANDLMLAEEIRNAVSAEIQIIKETDPLKIKGILSVSSGTVGSRFHGLVSALSQGVPALATGWSHKYQMLFEDYGFPEGLLEVTMSKNQIHSKLDLITNEATKLDISNKLKINSIRMKSEVEGMWREIIETVNK
ncbi:MAG: polysaccharide pyruvyl transferase family protein [Methyloprofundus sp.]|nr:polysaccharide pyruvyl transferase family protein [Methyloprofundus sp.]